MYINPFSPQIPFKIGVIGIAGHGKNHCDHQGFTMSTARACLGFVVAVIAVAVGWYGCIKDMELGWDGS